MGLWQKRGLIREHPAETSHRVYGSGRPPAGLPGSAWKQSAARHVECRAAQFNHRYESGPPVPREATRFRRAISSCPVASFPSKYERMPPVKRSRLPKASSQS